MHFTAKSESIRLFLERDHQSSFQNLNRLYEALRKLRIEGKLCLRSNLREIRGLLGFFQKETHGHMRLEEKTLFPFLKVHIPRLEPMIYLLLSEHEDLRNALEELKGGLSKVKSTRTNFSETIDKFDELGMYFICLCRSHLWVESQSLYRIADKELKPEEKKKLGQKIKGGR